MAEEGTEERTPPDTRVTYLLRDINKQLVKEWEEAFTPLDEDNRIQVSCGDIFRGAPAVDALVSPANSFGFMDGGIDMVYTNHFGWQMQERLQEKIRRDYDGEVLVGQAVIIPACPDDRKTPEITKNWAGCNEDQPIKWLISAPTMRVPHFVHKTVNAYLAFRAVILAVQKHNEANEDKIRTVMCPGLGTAVGNMPKNQCAMQMAEAYKVFELHKSPRVTAPQHLSESSHHHFAMILDRGYVFNKK